MNNRTDQREEELDFILGEARERLLSINDPEARKWFIKSLAINLGIQVVIGNPDPAKNFVTMGDEFERAFSVGGTSNPTDRGN